MKSTNARCQFNYHMLYGGMLTSSMVHVDLDSHTFLFRRASNVRGPVRPVEMSDFAPAKGAFYIAFLSTSACCTVMDATFLTFASSVHVTL